MPGSATQIERAFNEYDELAAALKKKLAELDRLIVELERQARSVEGLYQMALGAEGAELPDRYHEALDGSQARWEEIADRMLQVAAEVSRLKDAMNQKMSAINAMAANL